MQLSSKKGRAAPGNSLSAFPRALVGHAAACGAERVRKNLLFRFLGYYRPHLPMLAADLGCAVLVSATALALPLCANYITRQVTAFGASAAVLGQIYLIGAAMLGLLVLQVSSTFFVDYQGHMMGARIENQVRRELFEHCQKLSFSFYDRNRVGQLMSRITNDSLWLGEVFHHAPEDLTIMALKFGGVIAILMHIDPWMTGLILLPTPLALAYALYFARRMEAALARAKREIAAVNERIEDSLAGIRVVQYFANERLESRLFHAANSRFLQSRRHGYLSEAWFSAGTSSFAELVTIGVIVLGALRVAGRLHRLRAGHGNPRYGAGNPRPARRAGTAAPTRRHRLRERHLPLRGRTARPRPAFTDDPAGRVPGAGGTIRRRQEHALRAHPALLRTGERPHSDRWG